MTMDAGAAGAAKTEGAPAAGTVAAPPGVLDLIVVPMASVRAVVAAVPAMTAAAAAVPVLNAVAADVPVLTAVVAFVPVLTAVVAAVPAVIVVVPELGAVAAPVAVLRTGVGSVPVAGAVVPAVPVGCAVVTALHVLPAFTTEAAGEALSRFCPICTTSARKRQCRMGARTDGSLSHNSIMDAAARSCEHAELFVGMASRATTVEPAAWLSRLRRVVVIRQLSTRTSMGPRSPGMPSSGMTAVGSLCGRHRARHSVT